jgi:hypothetical protein
MAKNTQPYFTALADVAYQKFTSSDTALTLATLGSNPKLLVTSPTDDCKITAIAITSTDTAAKDVVLIHEDAGGNRTILGSTNIAINSGGLTGTNSATNGLSVSNFPYLPLDAYNNNYLLLKASCKLYVGIRAALTASQEIHVTCFYEKYS